jgi:heme iron utilization protein
VPTVDLPLTTSAEPLLAATTTEVRDPHRNGGFDPQPGVARLTHAEQARTLVHGHGGAMLSTVARKPEGFPFGSLVTYLADDQGNPWLLISAMAEHTANALADQRASVLVAATPPADTDPLASGRVTLIGTLHQTDPTNDLRAEFLTRHPGARSYVDFPDFMWWTLRVESVRYVGGFGRMSWVDAGEYATSLPDPIAPAAHGICAHMNADHADAHPVLLNFFLRRTDIVSAHMTGVDRLGCDLDAKTATASYPLRLPFRNPANDATDVRNELVAMLNQARLSETQT